MNIDNIRSLDWSWKGCAHEKKVIKQVKKNELKWWFPEIKDTLKAEINVKGPTKVQIKQIWNNISKEGEKKS